jgi:O-antigen ligase
LAIWLAIPGSNESGSVLDRILLASLGAAGMVVLTSRGVNWPNALRGHGWLLALLAYMFVSTLWSDIPLIALRRWARDLIVVIMALFIRSEANPRQAVESLLRRSAYILIPFSLVLVKYFPALGREYSTWSGKQMWTGAVTDKNGFGRFCTMSAFFLLWALYRHWRKRAPAGGRYRAWADLSVLLMALFLSMAAEKDSATAIGTFALGVAAFLILLWLRKLKLRVRQSGLLALVVFLIVFGTLAPFVGGSNLAGFTGMLGRDETLTGRTELWAALLPEVDRNPVLGHGYASFWTTDRRVLYGLPSGHNGYLDILLEMGVVGLAFYCVWLLSCLRQLHRALAEEYDWASLGICLLLMAVACNISESALTTLSEHTTAVLALVSFTVSCARKRRAHTPGSGVQTDEVVLSTAPDIGPPPGVYQPETFLVQASS